MIAAAPASPYASTPGACVAHIFQPSDRRVYDKAERRYRWIKDDPAVCQFCGHVEPRFFRPY